MLRRAAATDKEMAAERADKVVKLSKVFNKMKVDDAAKMVPSMDEHWSLKSWLNSSEAGGKNLGRKNPRFTSRPGRWLRSRRSERSRASTRGPWDPLGQAQNGFWVRRCHMDVTQSLEQWVLCALKKLASVSRLGRRRLTHFSIYRRISAPLSAVR